MSNKLKLSVIVPVYNEAATIAEILIRLVKVKDVAEVIVVDDGSQDESVKQIKKLIGSSSSGTKKTRITAVVKNNSPFAKIKLFKKQNGGKGSAVRLGLTKVTGNYVLIQDADLEYDPADIPTLLEPIKQNKAEVIYSSRFLGPHLNLLFWHKVANNFLNFLINILYNTTLSDMESCYKVLPTDLMHNLKLKANRFDLEPEITCKVLKRGIKIFEVPISYVGRDFKDGKKIRWQDGWEALWVIVRERVF